MTDFDVTDFEAEAAVASLETAKGRTEPILIEDFTTPIETTFTVELHDDGYFMVKDDE